MLCTTDGLRSSSSEINFIYKTWTSLCLVLNNLIGDNLRK